MINPKIEIDDRDVVAAFNRLIAIGENPGEALNAVGRVLKTRIQEGFESGTDPYGRPWAPLKSRSGQPLVNKGHLKGSVDYHVEGDSVEIGTNKPYAPVHQFGATIKAKAKPYLKFMVNGHWVQVKSVTIPARPMFPTEGLPDDWAADAIDAIGDVIERKLNL